MQPSDLPRVAIFQRFYWVQTRVLFLLSASAAFAGIISRLLTTTFSASATAVGWIAIVFT